VEARPSINLEPFALTKEQAFKMLGSPKVGQRMLFHGWLQIVRQGGRGSSTLIDYRSLKVAYQRWLDGDEPPLLPSEIKGAKRKNAQHLLSSSR
jgi:hypothetical protein